MNVIQNIYNQQPMQGQVMPPQQAVSMSRRARLGKRLMAGTSAFITSLPKWFATYAVGSYAIALLGVSMLYYTYAIDWYFWIFGIVWVGGFFFLSVRYSQEWKVERIRSSKRFERKLIGTGFGLRAIYVAFIYWFYNQMTGQPFEFAAADSAYYVEAAGDFSMFMDAGTLWSFLTDYAQKNFSDLGFPVAILPYIRWFGVDLGVFLILMTNAILGAYVNVIIYRMTKRSMDETTARLAAIFCMLHPVLICYVGLVLKEVLMTLLAVVFIDMAERMLRGRKYTFATIAPMVVVGISLFMFRTVLAMIAFMALFFALVMMDSKIISFGKKFLLGTLIAGILVMSASENIMNEVNRIMNTDVREQQETSLLKRYGAEKDKEGTGNRFAKYAGAAVFAPLIFTIPFPTMVKAIAGQEDMHLIHGGNWMRNVMSGLVILAMFMLLLTGDWRKYTLPLAMMLGYLLMLAFTQFAHSLRFHIPVMPFEMMFAAYALTNMRKKHRMWYLAWCGLMIVACFAWNWFKLAGRGLS